MNRGLTMWLMSSLVATIIAYIAMAFIFEPLMAFFVGSTLARFIALWALVALVIKFDDSIIVPIASRIATALGLDGVIRKK